MFATHIDDELITAIKRSKAPVVLIGQDGSGYNIPSVIHDDYRVGYCAAEQLQRAGCRSVGFLGVQSDDIAVDRQRYDGFSNALNHLGLSTPQFHTQGQFSIDSGREEMTRLLADNQRPDGGVFCATDRIAIGAIQAITAVGLKPGKDIKLSVSATMKWRQLLHRACQLLPMPLSQRAVMLPKCYLKSLSKVEVRLPSWYWALTGCRDRAAKPPFPISKATFPNYSSILRTFFR